jgi:hypothetical protein
VSAIDRLEGIASADQRNLHYRQYDAVLNALPDLLKAVRAAKVIRVEHHPMVGLVVIGLSDLEAALDPLFRKEES